MALSTEQHLSQPLAVLDNSAALAMVMPDERGNASGTHCLQVAIDVSFITPTLWRYEIANGLSMSLKRGRIAHSDLLTIFADLSALAIQEDKVAPPTERLLELAQAYSLTSYDAAYLELALRHKADLLTNDKALKSAALKAGINVL